MKARTVIRQERTTKSTRIVIGAVSLTAMFAAGFVSAVHLLGHPVHKLAPLPAASSVDRTEFHTVPQTEKPTRWSYDSMSAEQKCLADNMYFEGRSEDVHGKIAIGLVTLARVESRHYPDSICDVVWQQSRDAKTKRMVAQFSWTLDGKSDRIKNNRAYEEINLVAGAMIAEGSIHNFHDFTDGATHYHATYVNPYWADSLQQVASVGEHIFYR